MRIRGIEKQKYERCVNTSLQKYVTERMGNRIQKEDPIYSDAAAAVAKFEERRASMIVVRDELRKIGMFPEIELKLWKLSNNIRGRTPLGFARHPSVQEALGEHSDIIVANLQSPLFLKSLTIADDVRTICLAHEDTEQMALKLVGLSALAYELRPQSVAEFICNPRVEKFLGNELIQVVQRENQWHRVFNDLEQLISSHPLHVANDMETCVMVGCSWNLAHQKKPNNLIEFLKTAELRSILGEDFARELLNSQTCKESVESARRSEE